MELEQPQSRIEKFLYAICALDIDDLPTPMSRIEILWNCLITGETSSDYRPLSRNEEYLMYILGIYNNLPTPQSRGEVLLYKLATGDNDLSNIEPLQSRYEKLLAYIIENGGINGDIDFEYVKVILTESFTTLYNTKEEPIKSTILKGKGVGGLVNISSVKGEITIAPNSIQFIDSSLIKTNTIYTVSFNCSSVPSTGSIEVRQVNGSTALKMDNITVTQGYNQFIVLTHSSKVTRFRFKNDSASTTDFIFNDLMILEGDYRGVDIPYFDGIGSVKMPVLTTVGKNLIDLYINPENCPGEIVDRNTVVIQGYNSYTRYNIPVFLEINKTYTLTGKSNAGNIRIRTNSDGSGDVLCSSGETFTMNKESGIYYLSLNTLDYNGEVTFSNIQLEEGSVKTEYEPHKSTTVTCNEEVELRGIGNVKDELDLVSGELTQRIGEIVLDGSESWNKHGAYSTDEMNVYWTYNKFIPSNSKATEIVCDKLPVLIPTVPNSIRTNGDGGIFIGLPSEVNITSFLRSDPVTVHYKLATESVKTVDLSVVDQDGNNTKLSSFEDITHVTVTSDGILPDVELEVATKNEEVLNTMNLEMDDIYATQTTLEETSNAQSENVDATMIATTEIYEGLL